MSLQGKQLYIFGAYRLDVARRLLLCRDEETALTSKGFDLLLLLVQSSGRVLEKEELMTKLWPDVMVEEANLSVQISLLRKALGESPRENRYITTVPGHGYRFVAEVKEALEGAIDPVALAPLSLETEEALVKIQSGETSLEREADGSVVAERVIAWRRLKPILAVCAILIGLSLAAFYGWKSWQQDKEIRSIAILPFKFLNSGSDEYLGIGVADVLITRLGKLKQVAVRPTSAVLKYNDSHPDTVAVGREQRVDAVLEGSIQQIGDQIRITVRLIRIPDEVILWAEKFDEKMSNIFTTEDLIAQRLAEALAVNLSVLESRFLTNHETNNFEAHQLYLRGRALANKRTREGTLRGLECFEQAIKLDPAFALAYIGVADCFSTDLSGLSPNARAMRMKEAALKALAIDNSMAEAHTALAWAKNQYDWDWFGAQQEFKQAIELKPNYAQAHHWYALHLNQRGRREEALSEIKTALDLDPVSLIINTNMGYILACAHKYDQAITQFNRTLELDANFSRARFHLGDVYSFKGMHKLAITELKDALVLSGNDLHIKSALGCVYARAGKNSEAMEILRELDESCEREGRCVYDGMAIIRANLGDKVQAFELLHRAIEAHYPLMAELRVHPEYDNLRSDPRFTGLLTRMGNAP